jgi:DNA-binding MarR family transcriptional regulator/N-acetylglutamate synthase-like GNAT family acetyltransferase
MSVDLIDRRALAVRQFNRFYTQKIGVLREGYLGSTYPLPAVRLLYELAHRQEAIAADLARDLNVDQGYLSRIIKRLRKDGLIRGETASHDRRQTILSLTAKGCEAYEEYNQRSQDETVALLAALPEPEQRRLVDALQTAGRLLGDSTRSAEPPVLLREPRPGDMGWVVEAHGTLYAHEYGWTAPFEALAAEVVARVMRQYDPSHDRCWIAERDGQRVGSVCVIRENEEDAKLRLLLVDPVARGRGLGRCLVQECIRFARATGYRRLVLWTTDALADARRLYASEGFRMTAQTPFSGFGEGLMQETWALEL